MTRQFTFIVQTTINVCTTVEADSLYDAVEKATSQTIKRFCNECENSLDNDGQWVACTSIQGDPYYGKLIDCVDSSLDKTAEQTKSRYAMLEEARELWGY